TWVETHDGDFFLNAVHLSLMWGYEDVSDQTRRIGSRRETNPSTALVFPRPPGTDRSGSVRSPPPATTHPPPEASGPSRNSVPIPDPFRATHSTSRAPYDGPQSPGRSVYRRSPAN